MAICKNFINTTILLITLFLCQTQNAHAGWKVVESTDTTVTLSFETSYKEEQDYFKHKEGCTNGDGSILCTYIMYAKVIFSKNGAARLVEMSNNVDFPFEKAFETKWTLNKKGYVTLESLEFISYPDKHLLPWI